MSRPVLFAPLIAVALVFSIFVPVASAGFVDVAESAGLTVDPPLSPEGSPPSGTDPYVTGSPLCAADLDRDGWTDLIACPTPYRLRVFMNEGDGTFREEGIERGFGDVIDISGIAAGDLDNDGDTDIFLVPRSGDRYFLFVNDGTGHFTEEGIERGAASIVTGEPHRGQSIGLVDYDRDGFLDIHVTEWGVPGSADSHLYSVLLRNRGLEKPAFFTNVTQAAGLTQPVFGTLMYGFSSAWADFDEDGYPDLSLVSDFGMSQLWWNNGDGTFTEGRLAARVGTDKNGMGVAVADVDRDGHLDFFVSSFDNGPDNVLVSANRLYRYIGDRQFEDIAPAMGVTDSSWGWAASFLDADNDSLLDLVVTNGYPAISPPGANPPPNAILDASIDRTRFFRNFGTAMSEVGESWGITDTGFSRSAAILDYDNDGDEDIVIGSLSRALQAYVPWILYQHEGAPTNNWLRIRFTGTVSNRDGYGARVRVTTGNVTQTALYAPTNAYISQREPLLHFGLGSVATVDRVEVLWPNGATQELTDVAANQILSIVEPMETTNVAPSVVTQLQGGAFEKASHLTLTADVAGDPAPIITWFKDGEPISTAAGFDLEIRHLHPIDTGSYWFVATNAAGTVTSDPVQIDVTADIGKHTVARWWNEILLDAIRRDTPNPPVHARNLFHVSAALWDAYWAYQPEGWSSAIPVFHREDPDPASFIPDRAAAQREAMSYAAYTVIASRFAHSPGAEATRAGIRWLMDKLGYDPNNIDTTGNTPAAVGNRIGQAILAANIDDGANETGGYADATGYQSVNPPMIVAQPGTVMNDPNRWQPLSLSFSVTQNGIFQPSGLQEFVGVNAPLTRPFALVRPAPTRIFPDPGPPPQLGGTGHEKLVAEVVELIEKSAALDPADPTEIDISPGASLNNPLGTNEGTGRAVNPFTGQPYAPNVVLLADYGRILAEFWADGPDSETPPGHWNVLFNEISDDPSLDLRYGGVGPELSRLEWDVRGYFALNGAMHDAATAAWTLKWQYDSARPISLIRYMGGLGQSSDPTGAHYHELGLPIIPDLIELTTAESVAPGGRHAEVVDRRDRVDEFVGKIVIRAWRGNPADVPTQVGGVGWVLAERWMPYQRNTFVTPAFPGYVSGHSTFSRAAAEVLTLLTGSPYFPGGLGVFDFPKNGFLDFELGPSRDLELQWATYQDASDQAGFSRLFGGIHIAADDLVGRRLGARVGVQAFLKAHAYRSAGLDTERLVNVSTRGVTGPGERALIAGFVVSGNANQQILLRAVGPGLAEYGVPVDQLNPDPVLEVFAADGATSPMAVNDDWDAGAHSGEVITLSAAHGAFALTAGSSDAADVINASAGAYTMTAAAGNGTDSLPLQLVEAYGDRLANVSTRGYVGAGDSVIIGGFALTGSEPAAVLVRGIGPALAQFGVADPLSDPEIRVHRLRNDGPPIEVGANNDWLQDDRASLAEISAEILGAFPLDHHSKDAAIFLQLTPGVYTVTLSSRDNNGGIGLVEVYHITWPADVPPIP